MYSKDPTASRCTYITSYCLCILNSILQLQHLLSIWINLNENWKQWNPKVTSPSWEKTQFLGSKGFILPIPSFKTHTIPHHLMGILVLPTGPDVVLCVLGRAGWLLLDISSYAKVGINIYIYMYALYCACKMPINPIISSELCWLIFG